MNLFQQLPHIEPVPQPWALPLPSQQEQIRIARIITRLGVGGVERHVCTVSAHLDAEKFRSWLICGRAEAGERECSEFATELGLSPIVIRQLRRTPGLWDFAACRELNRVLATIQPQIVETHQSKAGALARSLIQLKYVATRSRPRLVHMFHCHHFQSYFRSPIARAFALIERCLAHLTDRILVVTPTLRRQLLEDYKIGTPDTIRVVPLGFDFNWVKDLHFRRGHLRSRIGATNSTVLFGFVGRLAAIKNPDLLLRAFAAMLRNSPVDARLAVIGDGPLLGPMRSLACELGITDRVAFCGWMLDRADIYSDLDVTCLSSFSEGSPVCLIESLAAGIPVVATNVGGVADIVSDQNDGALVPSGDADAYASALLRLGQHPRRLSAERALKVRSHYSIARLANDLEGIYSELMEDGAAGTLHKS